MSKKSGSKAAPAAAPDTADSTAQFWKALKGGDVEEVEKLLLQTSTSEGGETVVRRLPNATALSNSKNAKHLTPLCFAVDNGLEDHLTMLVRAGAKVNDIDGTRERRTPLLAAVAAEEDVMVQTLLLCGADPSVANADGHNVLHIAARNGSRHMFGYFLVLAEVSLADPPLVEGVRVAPVNALRLLEAQDHNGATPLHYALGEIGSGDTALSLASLAVDFLEKSLKSGSAGDIARIVEATTKSGCTVLHLVAASGVSNAKVAAVVKRVVALGCRVDYANLDCQNALHYSAASSCNNSDVFAVIADHMPPEGKSAVAPREDQESAATTPLEIAVVENNRAALEWVATHNPTEFLRSERSTLLARLTAQASSQTQAAVVKGKLVSTEQLEEARKALAVTAAAAAGELDADDNDGDGNEAGDYSGHGSTTFAGSRVQAARKATAQRRKETPEERAEREAVRKQVQESVESATGKRDEAVQAKRGGLSLGAKILVAFLMLSMLLPLVDMFLGAPRAKR